MKTSTLVEIAIGFLAVAVAAYFLVRHFLNSPGPGPSGPTPGPTPSPTPGPSGHTGHTGPCPSSQVPLPTGGCATVCGSGFCEATSQACIEVSNPDCSPNSPLIEPTYSCASGEGIQTKYRDCVISSGCGDVQDKKAYLCSDTTRSCYDTSNVQFLPKKVADRPPLYNVTAWKDYLPTCDVEKEDYIDTFCDYSKNPTGKTGRASMGQLFNAYVLQQAADPTEPDPVEATLDYFRESSYKMRQSPLGYSCLPVGSDPLAERPTGYRYVNFPVSKDADKNKCTMVDCLKVGLSHDVSILNYNDIHHTCMAEVCEGDECRKMSPSSPSHSEPLQKLATRDPVDGPYCSYKGTESLDTFKTDNCPQDSSLDCLPDNDHDGAGSPDVAKVYEQNGLQFWKPGQRNVDFCVTNYLSSNNHLGVSNDIWNSIQQVMGTTNVWPMSCDKTGGQCGNIEDSGVADLDDKDIKCLTKNVLDYLDKKVHLRAQGNYINKSAYQEDPVDQSEVDAIEVSEKPGPLIPSSPYPYSTKIFWHLNDQPNGWGSGHWSSGVCSDPHPDKC